MALKMVRELKHRGPDSEGVWVDDECGLALAHRRLSIIDLSPQGAQPMESFCGRYVTVLNGEIYNYQDIRREIDHLRGGCTWRGTSDTEVMLAAFSVWGVRAALEGLVGMFALAVWDKQDRVLHLARDRMGEKPLYYGWSGNALLFASELKAMRAYPDWRPAVDRDALALFMRYCYIPAPYSIYQGIRKLPAACLLSVSLDRIRRRELGDPVAYWSLDDAIAEGSSNPFSGTGEEAAAALETVLGDAVEKQMVADVPLGAFLSGGVDSSTIVALMQARSIRPVKTFTVGFHEPDFNEAEHARAVAQHLGTEHHELYVTPREALDVVPSLPALYDEPFSDSSQVPTYLISKLTRRQVKVSLSGDGGDELFGGYDRYRWGTLLADYVLPWPAQLRRGLALSLRALPPGLVDEFASLMRRWMPARLRPRAAADKLLKFSDALESVDSGDLYHNLASHWKLGDGVVKDAKPVRTIVSDALSRGLRGENLSLWMMRLDALTYLPDDILVKVDRAAMGVSLETRVPFLDHRVVEFCWTLPLRMKLRDGQGKWLLRQVLHRHVPRTLIDRPKTGFAVPIDRWLRGPLKDWAGALMDERRLQQEGFFDPEPIGRRWREHLAGKRNWQYYLWDVLMFQAWLEYQHA